MFGRVPRLPIDLILPTYSSTTPSQSKSSYVENWRDQMKEAYQLAFQYSDDRKQKMLSEETLSDHAWQH